MSLGRIIPDIAELLLDLPHGLKVCSTIEGISAHEEELDQISGYVSSSYVETPGEVRHSVSIVHRNNVCNTISRVDDNTGSETYCTKRESSAGYTGGVRGLRTHPARRASTQLGWQYTPHRTHTART